MDTVARVAAVASEHCFIPSSDDKSAFHHILLRPSPWPLFGFSYKAVEYVWQVLPSASALSPHVGRGKSQPGLHSKRIPALGTWKVRSCATSSPLMGWSRVFSDWRRRMPIPWPCSPPSTVGRFCPLRNAMSSRVRLQKYLGIWCDSSKTRQKYWIGQGTEKTHFGSHP